MKIFKVFRRIDGSEQNSNKSSNKNIEFGEENIKGDQGVNYRNKMFDKNLEKNKNINIDGEYID